MQLLVDILHGVGRWCATGRITKINIQKNKKEEIYYDFRK